MELRSGIKTKFKKEKVKRLYIQPAHLIKTEPMEVVDSEISFHFKNNVRKSEEKCKEVCKEDFEKSKDLCEEDFEDDEISFHFKHKLKSEEKSVEKSKEIRNEIEWLKTMVIIYQDWFYFDIKTEKKDDYEETVVMNFPKKKRRKKRRSY